MVLFRKHKQAKRFIALIALLTLLMSLIPAGTFAGATDGLVPPPQLNPGGGTFDQPVEVSISPGVLGGQVLYTLNGNDPISQGIPYLQPLAITATTVVTAVTVQDGNYSAPVQAVYTIQRTTYQRLQAMMGLLEKIAQLSNSQIRTLIDLAADWANLDVLSNAQQALLASNGLTAADLLTVIDVLKGQLYTEAQIDQFRTDVQDDNLFALVGLMDDLKNAFPLEFKDQLAAKGLSLDNMVDAFVDFSQLSFNQGLTVTGALQTSITEILNGNGIMQAVDQQILSLNGLNWQNLNTLIAGLSDQQKADLEGILAQLGIQVAPPQVSPASGAYNLPVTVSITPVTTGSVVYYTLDGKDPVTSGVQYNGSFTVDKTTVVKAVAYKDGTYSVPVQVVYTINRTTYQRLQAMLQLLQKVALLSNDQFRTITTVANQWASLDVLSDAQQALLASNGLTTADLQQVVAVVESKLGTDAQIDAFRDDIENDNLWALVGLMDEIKNAFPAAFKSELLARGVTADQLIDVFIDFSQLALTQGLTVTSELQSSMHDILLADGVFNAIDQQVLADNGLNWTNINALITGLSDQQKANLEAALLAMGLLLPVAPPQVTPAGGTSNQPVTVSITPVTAGSVVYYTLDGKDPVSSGVQYSGSFSIEKTTVVNAVAYKDGAYSAPVQAVYTINLTTYQRLQAMLELLRKVALLSNDQFRVITTVAGQWASLDVLSDAQRALLASNGLTAADLQQVVAVVESKLGTDAQINTFRDDIETDNLWALVGLMDEIKNAFPAAFKSELLARGITADHLINLFIDFSHLALTQGLTITSELQSSVHDIMLADGVFNAIDQQTLANNGFNWTNINALIAGLTAQQKVDLEAALQAMGLYILAPVANPAAGTYIQPQDVTLSSGTVGAAIWYTTNGSSPWMNGSPQGNIYDGTPISVNVPTVIKAVAVKDSVPSAVATFEYVIGEVEAPQASVAPGTYYHPVDVVLTSATEGAAIYYVTSGSVLDDQGNVRNDAVLYTDAIQIAATSTISAVAMQDSRLSDVSTFAYFIEQLQPPVATPGSGETFFGSLTVNLTAGPVGAKIFYTLNDGQPQEYDPQLGIALSEDTTLEAWTSYQGVESDHLVATYTKTSVEAPAATPGTGIYWKAQQVSLSQSQGAAIYFTTDASDPEVNNPAQLYTGGQVINVDQNMTIKAIAVLDGVNSPKATFDYIIGQVAAPVAVPDAGNYYVEQAVALSSKTPGTDIYYQLSGISAPQPIYPIGEWLFVNQGETIQVADDLKIWAVAVVPDPGGDGVSAVQGFAYTIGQIAAPEASKLGGTYYGAIQVDLSSDTEDLALEIYYTLDGTAPSKTSETSHKFTSTLTISNDTILRAIAYVGAVASEEMPQQAYLFVTVAAPVASPLPGTLGQRETVTLTSATEGAAIYYTTDGTSPWQNNQPAGDPYNGAIAWPTTANELNIKAVAVKSEGQSEVKEFNYKLAGYSLVIKTDSPNYRLGIDPIVISGIVTRNGQPYPLTEVAMQLNAPDGSQMEVGQIRTGTDGKFSVTIQPGTIAFKGSGLYTVHAQAVNDLNAKAQFVVADTSIVAPVADVLSGIYAADKTINLTSSTPSTIIYYTIDGSNPADAGNPNRSQYDNPLGVTAGNTLSLKAVAALVGNQVTKYSQVVSFNYEVLAAPQASPGSSTLTGPTLVTLTKINAGANIYYTLDNSNPRTSSTRKLYAGPVLVSNSMTLLAVTAKAGFYSQELQCDYVMSTGSIQGQVTYQGTGVPGIQVMLGVRTTTTDASGNYSFGDLIYGSYVVTVPGQNGYSQLKETANVESAGAVTKNFALLKGGTVAGRLTDMKYGFGIAGIEVNIGDPTKTEQSGYWASSTTDADGYFRLEGLRTDANYYLTTWNELGYIDLGVETEIGPIQVENNKLTIPDTIETDFGLGVNRILVDLDGELEQIMDMEAYRATSISGTAKKDDLAETPLGGVYVEAWSDQTGSNAYDISSDGTDGREIGTYNLEGLAPGGGYTISAWSDLGVNRPNENLTNITLAPNPPLEGKDIVIEVARTIAGIVQNSSGNPIAGVQVSAQSDSTGARSWAESRIDDPLTPDVDETGTFELPGLPAGIYTVYTWNNQFYENDIIDNVSTEVGNFTITLLEAGKITGTVVDSNGTAIEGVRINAWDPITYGWSSVTSNEDGTFTLRGLTSGSNYQLDFWKTGYYGKSMTLVIDDPDTIEDESTSDKNNVATGEVTTLKTVYLQMLGESQLVFNGDKNSIKAQEVVVAPGKTINYRIDFRNNSNLPVLNGKLKIKLPAQSTFQGSNKGSWQDGILEITLPAQLDPGKGGVVTAKTQVNSDVAALQLTAAASMEYQVGGNQEIVKETIGVVATEVAYTTIGGPNVAQPGPVTIYGESSKDAAIEVWSSKDGGQARKLKTTKADGKWWSSTIDFSQTPLLGEGDYQLYAVAVVQGQQSNASQQITLAVQSNIPVVKEVTIVEAGWNKNVKSNQRTGFPTMAVAENSPIKVQVKFEAQGGDPVAGSVKLHFLDKVVTLTGSNLVYDGTIFGPWSGFGEEHITLTYQSGTKIYSLVVAEILILIDPSGYIYDADLGDVNGRLEGVLAVVEYNTTYNPNEPPDDQSVAPKWVRWDAAKYGQVNPQYTDANGRYGWDVPMGQYRVIFSKDGFESHISRIVTVPPPETELNVGLVSMLSLETPVVLQFQPSSNASGVAINAAITATFSKAMDQATLTTDSVQLLEDTGGDAVVDGSGPVVPVDVAYDQLARTVTLTPDDNLNYNAIYVVKLDGSVITDTNGNNLPNYTWSFTTAAKVTMATIQTSLPAYRTGTAVSISGNLLVNGSEAEAAGQPVAVTVTKPNGSTVTVDAALLTGADGSYSTSYTPDVAGDYSVAVDYEETELAVASFKVRDVAAPTANPAAGNFSGDSSVSLSTSTPNASIYYTKSTGDQAPDNPAPGVAGTSEYTNTPITVTVGTTTIKAIAVIEVDGTSVSSEVAEFEYVITAKPVDTSGGGGGGGGGLPPVVKPAEPTLDLDDVNKQLDQGAAEVSLQLPADAKEQKASVSADALAAITKAGKPVVIKGAQVQLQVPVAVLELAKGKALDLSFEEVPAVEADKLTGQVTAGFTALGRVVDLTMTADGQQLQFNQPVTVTFNYKDLDLSKVNEGKLGVYWYNDSSKQWDYVGGKINVTDRTITFKTSHFSTYAIMEFSKVFTDMGGHWAKEDAELMASKHIINGKTAELFDPETSVTRAEFAALMVRSLGLKGDPQAVLTFQDVAADKWYYGEIATAYNQGLVYGNSATEFAPDASISREQMAVMVMRVLEKAGQGATVTESEVQAILQTFKDTGTVSKWALPQTAAAVKLGVITGRSTDQLVPQAISSRAEAAVILHRMVNSLN